MDLGHGFFEDLIALSAPISTMKFFHSTSRFSNAFETQSFMVFEEWQKDYLVRGKITRRTRMRI
jgi:hypothetical protein